ncbi:MAG: transcriptional repressor LexA [Coriobacteriales bacterium]|jgi:repressor LexA|nr:transcriptional repressor LexA [Coriobacteriales bacterium]
MVRETISGRQRQVLEYIAEFTATQGYPPSVRDIGDHVGLASPSTVFTHLTGLEHKGFIRRGKEAARAITILDKGWQELGKSDPAADAPDAPLTREPGHFGSSGSGKVIELPLLGQIAAGEPILATQNITDNYVLPKQLVGDRGSFMLTVKGDSMIEAGINNGDYVVVREQPTAQNGDIVVALIGEDATVKTFYKEKDRIRLQPQNSSMDPIYPDEVQIVGKVIALLRAL